MMLPVIVAWCSLAVAGRWIVPDWPAGQEPKFEPVHLYWFEVRECPLIYRTEVEVPKEADRATALLRTSGYVYVCVDGRQVYAWAPREKTKDQPAVPADPNRVHELDFTPHLTPGRHVLTVSAPAKGFVLDGGLYAGAKRLAPLASDKAWTVAKFPPTTIVEDEPAMRPGFKGAGGVSEGDEWAADEDALAKAHYAASVQRCRRDLDDLAWRLELLTRKGIYIAGDAAHGWGGPGRLDPELLRKAGELLRNTGVTGWRPRQMVLTDSLEQLEKRKVESVRALEEMRPVLAGTRRELDRVRAETEALSSRLAAADERKGMSLVLRAVPGGGAPRASLDELGKELGHPLPRLNESRYDRLGWINHPELTDSDIGKWGVRINPVTGPTKVAAPRQWLFSTDPKDEGLKELRWSIGHNIEGQWPRINPTQSWTRDPRFADYKGVAWYRTRIQIPSEWAGNEVHVTFSVAGKERLWLNDMEITELGAGEGKRTYKIPANYIAPGAENSLAIRVEADGPQRGLVGPLEASCPALEGPEAKATPPVAILATPLSPCVVLTPETDTIEIRHGGKGRLQLPGSGVPLIELERYEPAKPGRLPAGNWALVSLSPATRTSPQRPILLVFEQDPLSLVSEEGVTRIKLPRPGVRVIAVRPWAKLEPGSGKKPVDILSEARFWSQAALAVPINYMTVTRVLKPGEPIDDISASHVPRGPVLGHTVIYDYLVTKDQWGTKPLTLAPLPALCSFALDCGFRTLKLDQEVKVLQDGGLLAPYRGIVGADRVSYSYEVEPYPRFAGFTSWMFSGVDTGVLGNKRELELVAATGANSYRPQHNFSDEMPPKNLDPSASLRAGPGGGRTRVQCIADYCQSLGLNYMNNIDQTLGRKQEFVRNNYPEFMELVTVHLEKIARQLHSRPFWAVAYDLINEPFDHKHERYNPAMKELTRRVRAIDKTHLCYVEPCEAWGAIQQLRLIEPTGDPLTVYSFHDYNFRLHKAEDRWPTLDRDITSIYRMWLPAIEFQIKHGVCMHCGEFGGHAHPTDESVAQLTLMNDFFRIFDQFGMHHHYYTGRDVYQRLADGSIRPSNVIRAYRAYFRRPDFNLYHRRWPGHPELPKTR
jgi:uncharacterized coiled-coil protein SlyX